jgi:predicted ATPase/class 3 adenylate cyclase
MLNELSAYIAQDRREALARGGDLPNRTSGAALFADVTGFTPLAEALALAHGPRRGAEELTALLNQVYSALIIQIEQFGGSVIGFSGDAITCWFDDGGWESGAHARFPTPASLRALAAALAMKRAMTAFAAIPIPSGATAALMVKIAIAAGPIRRFLIGDPQIQVLEILAGRTLDLLAAAAHVAEHDDVVVDELTLARIKAPLHVAAWRIESETQQRAAIIADLPFAVAPAPWPAWPANRLSDDQMRPWAPPAVYARVRHSADPFLAELRPVVALMLQFGGFDYDSDESAGAKLDAYIRQVQATITRYDGHLVDVTMADKGGYLFAAFGALHAHEDDARRATLAALELRSLRVTPESEAPRIGISQGTMRTGPYGGATRRAYGVLGDDVNLACRLMSAAAPGQILVKAQVQHALMGTFQWAALPALRVKGKRALVAVYHVLAETPALPVMLEQATPPPMIGRAAEYAVLTDALTALVEGASGVVIVDGEAGIGKSRLIAELGALLREREVVALTGAGQSIAQTSYYVWRAIFRSYFGLDHELMLAERQARVQVQLAEVATELLDRLPLLNDILNLGLDDTDFTRSLDAAERGEQLADLLVELLRARASKQPLTIVLDDAHLLDSRSLNLVVRAAQACMAAGGSPQRAAPTMLFILALRSLDATHPAMPQLMQLLGLRRARRITLGALSTYDIITLAAVRLGVASADLPAEVGELVRTRAGGNPFFAEELVAALRDEGAIRIETVAIGDANRARCVVSGDLSQAAQSLPATLQGLILGRIDRLPPAERLTLRMAAVIGPTFEYRALHYIRNQQAAIDEHALKNQLRALAAQDFTWLETPEPHLAYRFKHTLTQEAAYQSLLYTQRREIHRLIAGWYEQTIAGKEIHDQTLWSPHHLPIALYPYVPLLAYHYRLAEDMDREQLYVALLGEQAINASAFQEAIACFERALSLTPPHNSAQRSWLAAQLGRTYLLLGDTDEAEQRYHESMALAAAAADRAGEAGACFDLGALAYRRKAYAAALALIERSLALYRAARDQTGEGRALDRLGAIYTALGDEAKALECYQQALALGQTGRSRRRGGA